MKSKINVTQPVDSATCNAANHLTACMVDSTSAEVSQSEKDNTSISLGAFGIPFLILLVAALCKYFILRDKKIKVLKLLKELFLELSIDTTTIMVAVLISYYHEASSGDVVGSLFLIAMVLIIVGSIIRRCILDKRITDSCQIKLAYAGCWVLTIVGLVSVYCIIR